MAGPSFIEKLNYVQDFFALPCDTDLVVYAKTALPAAGTAILTLLTFGLADVVRGAARPKSLRKQKRYRGKKPPIIRLPNGQVIRAQLPEIGNLLGKTLGDATGYTERTVPGGAKHLWRVDGVGQRALWHVLIADVLTTFAYDWTSAIVDVACNTGESARARGLGVGSGTVLLTNFNPHAIIAPARYTIGLAYNGSGQWRANTVPGMSAFAVAVITLRRTDTNPNRSCSVRVRAHVARDFAEPYWQEGTLIDLDAPGDSGQTFIQVAANPVQNLGFVLWSAVTGSGPDVECEYVDCSLVCADRRTANSPYP